MSIGPIQGVSAHVPAGAAKPESMETPGTPDHDHDSDDSPANAVAAASKTATRALGRVDVKA